MSELMRGNNSFLKLLISSQDKNQQEALLKTITESQHRVLTEIFHNFIQLPLNERDSKIIKKNIKLVKLLANPNKSYRVKRHLFFKHKRFIFHILATFQNQLIALLE